MFTAVEGAEDDRAQGAADLRAQTVGRDDVVILIAASGTTPYVLGAAEAARARGALTIAITNNRGTPLAAACDCAVVLDTGPEVISGSTRLKAGTAQKIALNTLSSSLMVRLHKVYGNLMVDLRATNAKLQRRALALTMRATGAGEAAARAALAACGERVKAAIVMLKAGVDAATAQRRLDLAAGSVHRALAPAGVATATSATAEAPGIGAGSAADLTADVRADTEPRTARTPEPGTGPDTEGGTGGDTVPGVLPDSVKPAPRAPARRRGPRGTRRADT
jgi:hypothetical protein